MTKENEINTIYLAMGTNIGDLHKNIQDAINILNEAGITVIKQSKKYITTPMYNIDQQSFLNLAIECQTHLSPLELLKQLKSIESNMGRIKTIENGPRIIDLDILYYNDILHDDNENFLHIPHVGISERQFVLSPMNDIAPDLIDPRTKQTIKQMLDKCSKDDNIKSM